MTRVSLLSPYDPVRPDVLVPFAELVRRAGFHALWQGNSVAGDATLNAAYLAGRGYALPYGFGVRVTGFAHPTAAAMSAAGLARTTGAPVVAGIGPGGRSAQVALHGAPLPSVLDHMRRYASTMRATLERMGPADVELGFGVLRPRMARLSGETADAAITWMTPPSYLREVIEPALRDGAAAVGRTAPRVVAMIAVGIGVHGRELEFARGTVGTHLSLPHYRDALERAGIRPPGPDGIDAAVFDRLVDGGVLYPDGADGVARAIRAYRDAGADEVVLNVTGSAPLIGPRDTLDGLIEIATVLHSHTPQDPVQVG